nr:reverse transcriptase domain-containing protein [Tanacetum cinerariifolium]
RLIRDQYLDYEDNLDPEGGTFAPAGQVQGGPSPAFVKENINILRTMIKEVDNRGQEKVTPRKLFNEESGGARSENSQMSPSAEEVGGYSSDGSSRSSSQGRPRFARKNRRSVSRKKGISKSYRSVRSEARSRSKSKSVKSKPQSVRASRRKSSSDSGYDNVSDSDSEDLSMPYRQPKPMHFTYRITRFRYHNMNKCYHIKKQIEEAVASGRLAHLVKDIRQDGQRARAQPKVKRRARRIHVDGGSSLEVMYEHCFRNLSYRTRSRLKESIIPLVGFLGEVDYPLGVIDLEVTMGECGKTRLVILKSAVVKSPSLYNALLGGLSAECRHALIHTFRKNVDIFAWTPIDMTGFQYKCFLDAYKGYHQIQMTKKDEEKTAFHMEDRVFCYTKMPFGLKNARATYQRLVDSAFKGQIGDSDPLMEEIDLYFNPDDPMPPGIEEDDDDSERDIPILEELLDNYSLSLPTNESYHFDIPSPYRPPGKPPDGNTGTLNIKMMGDVFDQKIPIPNPTITHILNQEKSPDLSSHQGFEAFQPSAECPIMINGKNTPVLDPGHLAARLGCAEMKVAIWDDLAFKLITLGWNVKH